MNTLRLYKTRTGYRWTYTHRNGRKLANGGQGYSRRMDMVKVLVSLFPDFEGAEQWFFIGMDRVKVLDETKKGRAGK